MKKKPRKIRYTEGDGSDVEINDADTLVEALGVFIGLYNKHVITYLELRCLVLQAIKYSKIK